MKTQLAIEQLVNTVEDSVTVIQQYIGMDKSDVSEKGLKRIINNVLHLEYVLFDPDTSVLLPSQDTLRYESIVLQFDNWFERRTSYTERKELYLNNLINLRIENGEIVESISSPNRNTTPPKYRLYHKLKR